MLNLATIKTLAQIQDEQELSHFRQTRQAALDSATVTTAVGNIYNADETSIGRMANALLAITDKPADFAVYWSMANTATGVMTLTTKSDLTAAHRLAVENMSSIWVRQ